MTDATGPHATTAAGDQRVTTLELFFDLVFVFTLTQLTEVLVHEGLGRGLAQGSLMLGIIFFMYGGYAWLTNAVVLDTGLRRGGLLAGMAAYLTLALAVPDAFADTGAAFGLAYLVVVGLHLVLYRLSSSVGSRRGILAIAPSNLAGAGLVLAGGLAGGTAQYALWAAAVAVLWLVPLLGAVGSFELSPAHFIERHGLVVIVAIGESVVAIGLGAREAELSLGLVAITTLGLGLNALLWWTYFGGDDARAETALEAMPAGRRGRAALLGYGHCHLALLGGVIAVAAGLTEVVAHPGEALEATPALELAGGAALFLLGDAALRRTLGIGDGRWRALAGVALLVTVPLGLSLSGAAMLVGLVALYALALGVEAQQVPASASRTEARASTRPPLETRRR